MSVLQQFVSNTLELALDAAPWLLLGLVVAGLIKAWIPQQLIGRWLGGRGVLAVVRAALIGAPLPLCSCGAIPLGLAIYRGGASRGPSTAFMVGTPGVGIDSVALTYALLGPLLAVIRPLAAVFSAVVTGLLVGLTGDGSRPPRAAEGEAGGSALGSLSCSPASCSCEVPADAAPASFAAASSMSDSPGPGSSMAAGLRYSFTEVLDDISWWLLLGLVVAGLLLTMVPPGLLAQYAVGPGAMLLMALIGIPMYLCAQAATPVAAALIVAGVSPGTALVLLLAGPITSIATLSVLRNEFGFRAVTIYVVGVAGTAVFSGLFTDAVVAWLAIDLPAQIGTTRELLPAPIKYLALLILLVLAIRPLRRQLF